MSGVLLLRKHRRAGGEAIVEAREAELLRRPEHPLLADPAEMDGDQRQVEQRLGDEVTIGSPRRASSRRRRRNRDRLAVERRGRSAARSRPARQHPAVRRRDGRSWRAVGRHRARTPTRARAGDGATATPAGRAGGAYSPGGRRHRPASRPLEEDVLETRPVRTGERSAAPVCTTGADRLRPDRCDCGRCGAWPRPAPASSVTRRSTAVWMSSSPIRRRRTSRPPSPVSVDIERDQHGVSLDLGQQPRSAPARVRVPGTRRCRRATAADRTGCSRCTPSTPRRGRPRICPCQRWSLISCSSVNRDRRRSVDRLVDARELAQPLRRALRPLQTRLGRDTQHRVVAGHRAEQAVDVAAIERRRDDVGASGRRSRTTTRSPECDTSATHSPITRRSWSSGAIRSGVAARGRRTTVEPPGTRTLIAPRSSRSRDTVACVAAIPSDPRAGRPADLGSRPARARSAGRSSAGVGPSTSASLRRLAVESPTAGQPGEDGAGAVEPVVALLDHDAARAVDHLGGHLEAAVGGQAVQEDRIRAHASAMSESIDGEPLERATPLARRRRPPAPSTPRCRCGRRRAPVDGLGRAA